MTEMLEAARRIGAARAELIADALVEAADGLAGIAVRREGQAIVLRGRALARRLAFTAPLAVLVAALKVRR